MTERRPLPPAGPCAGPIPRRVRAPAASPGRPVPPPAGWTASRPTGRPAAA